MPVRSRSSSSASVRVIPANEASWGDLEVVLGEPKASTTSGLVAYVDGEPAGWCAVEPRCAYVRLGRTPWADFQARSGKRRES